MMEKGENEGQRDCDLPPDQVVRTSVEEDRYEESDETAAQTGNDVVTENHERSLMPS